MTTAADLARRLNRAPRRIGAIAAELGFERTGRDWLFSPAQCSAIERYLAKRPGGEKISKAKRKERA